MPAHVIDDLKARAIVDAAEPAVGLSGPKDWRAQQAFLNPIDTESDQRGFALGYPNAQPPIRPQICCCVAALAFLRIPAGDIQHCRGIGHAGTAEASAAQPAK